MASNSRLAGWIIPKVLEINGSSYRSGNSGTLLKQIPAGSVGGDAERIQEKGDLQIAGNGSKGSRTGQATCNPA